jgi:hypothetical protein
MNKPKSFPWFLLLTILFFVGCVPVDSLNPLYTDKDIIFDAALLGVWVGPDANDNGDLKFDKEGANAYQIIMTDNGGGEIKRTFYSGHLLAIGDHRFLDIVPQNWEARRDSYVLHLDPAKSGTRVEPRLLKLGEAAYMEFSGDKADSKGTTLNAQLRTAHWFFKVWTDGKKLRLDFIDDDKFRKAIEQGKVHLGNALLGDAKNKDVVITADTKELQKFVIDHADDEVLFTERMTELQRKPQ